MAAVTLRATVLGCGSSGGVPRLGGHWGDCDPSEPRNTRRRCSLLVEKIGPDGTTAILFDTTPDLRAQLLDADIGVLNGVVYTHAHADHVHGIDDLRMVVFNIRQRLPVWADGPTADALLARFGYAFVQPDGSPYPPILDLKSLGDGAEIDGPGGTIRVEPIEVEHGTIDALGLKVGGMVYMPDVSSIPDAAWAALTDLDVWIIDALRRTPHPSHAHLERTLEWIERAAPRRAILTNMHLDMDYQTVLVETAAHIEPAFDGMQITLGAS